MVSIDKSSERNLTIFELQFFVAASRHPFFHGLLVYTTLLEKMKVIRFFSYNFLSLSLISINFGAYESYLFLLVEEIDFIGSFRKSSSHSTVCLSLLSILSRFQSIRPPRRQTQYSSDSGHRRCQLVHGEQCNQIANYLIDLSGLMDVLYQIVSFVVLIVELQVRDTTTHNSFMIIHISGSKYSESDPLTFNSINLQQNSHGIS